MLLSYLYSLICIKANHVFQSWTSEGFVKHCPINRTHARQAEVSSFCHFVSFFFSFIYLFIYLSLVLFQRVVFVWEEFMIKKRYSSMERRGEKADDLVERSVHGVYRGSCSTTTIPSFWYVSCSPYSLSCFFIQHLFSLFCASFSSIFRASYLCVLNSRDHVPGVWLLCWVLDLRMHTISGVLPSLLGPLATIPLR